MGSEVYKNKKKIVLLLFVTVVCVVIIGAIPSFLTLFETPKFDAPVPIGWEKIGESGEISSFCIGGWEECGSITREYATGKDARASLEDLRLAMEREKWIFEEDEVSNRKYNVVRASATADKDDWDRVVYIEFTDLHATVKYVKR